MGKTDSVGTLEKIGTSLDGIRLWATKAWRIARLMAKGAYLVGERKRLFEKLGEEVYYRILKGELHDPELESTVHQLDRLTKKVEIEEMLIRNQRFGHRPSRTQRTSSDMTQSEG